MYRFPVYDTVSYAVVPLNHCVYLVVQFDVYILVSYRHVFKIREHRWMCAAKGKFCIIVLSQCFHVSR
jgi:hypothetical protein